MKKLFWRYLRPVAAPLNYIEEKPFHFGTWALVAIVLGLSGVWLPTLLSKIRGAGMCDFLFDSVNGGALAAFSVVILADGIATAVVKEKSISETQSNASRPTASGVRGMVTIVAIVIVVVQVGVMGILQPTIKNPYFTYNFEVLVTWVSIIVACYLYCFRSDKWEQSIEDAAAAVSKENTEVTDLSKEAASRNTDGGDTKI